MRYTRYNTTYYRVGKGGAILLDELCPPDGMSNEWNFARSFSAAPLSTIIYYITGVIVRFVHLQRELTRESERALRYFRNFPAHFRRIKNVEFSRKHREKLRIAQSSLRHLGQIESG